MFTSILKNHKNKVELKNIEDLYCNDVKWFCLDGLNMKCKCIDVYDGDTITIIFPFLHLWTFKISIF